MTPARPAFSLLEQIAQRRAHIGVVGLGAVGWPLAQAFAEAGFAVTGVDTDAARLVQRATHGLSLSTDPEALSAADCVLLCVPTPLDAQRLPDLGPVRSAAAALVPSLRPGMLVVLESTSFSGTTEEVLRPILERSGLIAGRDFHLAFSPERHDPGNLRFGLRNTPKLVAGLTPACREVAEALYRTVVETVLPVSSLKTAEMAKLLENLFRSVNIALVNEVKQVCLAEGIDVWEVIDAAASKPFGFMAFRPGPGLGGHCIPVDPVYFTSRSRALGVEPVLVEAAAAVNEAMPRFVLERLRAALAQRGARLAGARILVLGLAYKPEVADARESPGARLLQLLEAEDAQVDYHDPWVRTFGGRASVALEPEILRGLDAAVVTTDHRDVDYRAIAEHARLVLDTRHVFARLGFAPACLIEI